MYANRAARSMHFQIPPSYASSSSLMPFAGSRYIVSGQKSSHTAVAGMTEIRGDAVGVKARMGKTQKCRGRDGKGDVEREWPRKASVKIFHQLSVNMDI